MPADNVIGLMRVISKCFLMVTLLLPAYDHGVGAEPRPNPTTADELKQLNDPTLLVTHVSLESEWDQFKDDSEKGIWTVNGHSPGCGAGVSVTVRIGRYVSSCPLSTTELMGDQINVIPEVWATWSLGQAPRFV